MAFGGTVLFMYNDRQSFLDSLLFKQGLFYDFKHSLLVLLYTLYGLGTAIYTVFFL